MKHTFYLLFLVVLFGVQSTITAQTTFFLDNFENSTGWIATSGTANNWVIGTCENNGGLKGAYVTSGGVTNDCTPTGIEHYGYTNASSGTEETVLYHTVDATCFDNLVVKFDLKVEGETALDYFEIVVSQDNGATWQVATAGGAFDGLSSYVGEVFALPASVDQSVFLVGLRFTYNSTNATTLPAAVDNFRIEGTSLDISDPVVTCPASVTRGTNASCAYTLEDFTSLISATDDCSSTFVTNQNPAPGATLAIGNTNITFSAFDQSGNEGTCVLVLSIIDTIPPSIVCPPDQSVYANPLCSAQIGSHLLEASATDNCSPSNMLIFTQNPPPPNYFFDTVTVTMSVVDEFGNTNSCTFFMWVIDTIAPVVTCQSDTMVNVTTPCNYAIPDLVGTHSAVDYCTPNALLSFSQSPLAGTMVSGVQDVIITYIDTAGNSGTCITHVSANETQLPTITCPSTQTINVTTCADAIPDLTSLAVASDNCSSVTLSQSPPVGTILSTGSHPVTIYAEDENGNIQSCMTTYVIHESVLPQITCPPNQTVCDPLINYASPSATDNCLFLMTQTDGSGFTDGSIFPVGITTQTYQVVDSSGNSASCSFTIEVLDYPDTAQVVNDTILLCSVFTTDIAAMPIQSGTANWSIISGTGVLDNPTSLTPNVSNLSFGVNQIQWIVASATCGQRRDTVTIIVSDFPTQSVLPDTLLICTEDGYVVQGNVPTSGIGTWSSENNITQFANPNAPITQVTDVPELYSKIYWVIGTPGCTSTIDSSIVYRPAAATILQSDTSLCIESLPYVLVGSPVGSGQFSSWSVVDGFAALNSSSSSSSTLTTADPGMITVVYRLNHPACGLTTDTLILSLDNCDDAFSDVPTLFTPNGDGNNDFFELGNLHELHPDCSVTIVNRYGSVIYESTGYEFPWDGTFNGEPVPFGTYFYSVTSPNDSFESFTGSISIIR